MYHSKIDESDRKDILTSLKNEKGVCIVLFSTIAFGMGVDVPNTHLVILMTMYRKLRGQGKTRSAMPSFINTHVSKLMKEYVQLDKGCRQKFLLKQFVSIQSSYDGVVTFVLYTVCVIMHAPTTLHMQHAETLTIDYCRKLELY